MSSNIVPFNFEDYQVRVVRIDGEPWFVLADICKVLAIRNVGDTSSRLDDDVKGVATVDTPGGQQQVTIVSEPGMYEVVLLAAGGQGVQAVDHGDGATRDSPHRSVWRKPQGCGDRTGGL